MTPPRPAGSVVSGRPTVLERILSETRMEVARRKQATPLGVLEAQMTPAGGGLPDARPGCFREALARPGIGVIAEFKRRSPSAGVLREGADVGAIVGAYERGGASALSVLTEGPNFDGSLADLGDARAACGLPVLRKDFIVDPYQLYEARVAGADAVLLIVAALDQDQMVMLYELASTLGLDTLVEVHDREELARAASVGARIIGVNNRDLRDFSVDVQRTSELLEQMPASAIVVSESGIALSEQLQRLEREGVSAVLVGESLMRAPDPQQALTELLAGSSSSAGAARIAPRSQPSTTSSRPADKESRSGSNLL